LNTEGGHLAQRLEMGDPFYHEIITQGKVQYARS
jgi:hypothetical protein